MSIDLTIPDNFNPIFNNCFHFEIKSLPYVSGMAQRFNMPGVSLGRANRVSPMVDYNMPGDKVTFEDLEIAFLVDENMNNFMEIFHWMVYLGFPRDTRQFEALYRGKTKYTETSDIILTTTTNKMNANRRIHFVDAFPVTLTPVEFVNTDTVAQVLLASAMFSYKYYYFEQQDPVMEGTLPV